VPSLVTHREQPHARPQPIHNASIKKVRGGRAAAAARSSAVGRISMSAARAFVKRGVSAGAIREKSGYGMRMRCAQVSAARARSADSEKGLAGDRMPRQCLCRCP